MTVRHFCLLSLVALVSLFPPIMSWAVTSSPAPQLRVPSPTHDFGQVRQGEVLEHSFTIRNHGHEPLRIQNVRTT